MGQHGLESTILIKLIAESEKWNKVFDDITPIKNWLIKEYYVVPKGGFNVLLQRCYQI